MGTISEEIAAYERRQKTKHGVDKTCYSCGITLQESRTGNRPTDFGASCSDCYYETLGQLIEKHPITSAHAPRG